MTTNLPSIIVLLAIAAIAVQSFSWNPPNKNHDSITREAISLTVTNFLTQEGLLECESDKNSYNSAVEEFIAGNRFIDADDASYWTASNHFDAEAFLDGAKNLQRRREVARMAVQDEEYSIARRQLGGALHGVQDFYSHSNWVEMGFTKPSPGTLGNGQDFGVPLAKPDDQTCIPCEEGDVECYHGKILVKDLLTSGHYPGTQDDNGETIEVPDGKCYHDGDTGISKDGYNSPHGEWHEIAAGVATEASADFLADFINELTSEQTEKLFGLDDINC